MASREVTRAVMATAAASLFVPESLVPGKVPRLRHGLGELRSFYERMLEQTGWKNEKTARNQKNPENNRERSPETYPSKSS